MIEIDKLTIEDASKKLREKEISSVELTKACLKNIEEKNQELNVFLEVFNDAIEQAKVADEMIKNNLGNQLTGIPLAIKDNILITGRKCSAASKMLENYTASYDAFVIKKLKDAGAILVGRTNMDEFAMGGSTENSAFGPVKNPNNPTYVPGGSSGGSAAAVASGMALGALGSDTGGSIRQPASFCGIFGMKPSYGAISRSGLISMASSLDQIGPFAKTIKDLNIIFETIIGKDEMDSTSIMLSNETIANRKVIGIPKDFLKEGVDEEVLSHFYEALEKLKGSGYKIVDIDLPHLCYSLAVYYIIMPAEVSTNLSRFDGIRYGLFKSGDNFFDDFKKSRSAGFGAEVRRRIILGTYVLSHGYYDAYYNQAWKVRRMIEKEFEEVFQNVNFVAMPAAPTPAYKFGSKAEPLQMYLEDIFTVPANLAGIPAISIPIGFSKSNLPIGIQFYAPFLMDRTLFNIKI